MNIVVTLAAFLVVIAGVLFSQNFKSEINEDVVEQQFKVLSQEENVVVGDLESEDIEPATISSILTPTPKAFGSKMDNYRYPGSEAIDSSANSLLLNSGADTDTIIDWYKGVIRSEGMGAKTFVTTKTNNVVLSKLVGADGRRELRVEISRDSENLPAKINVSLHEDN